MNISTHQAAVGAAVVHANAVNLLQAARSLKIQGLHGHATALAILSAEESSKALVLLGHVNEGQHPTVLRDVFVKHAIKLSVAQLNAEQMLDLVGKTGLFPELATGTSVASTIASWLQKWSSSSNALKQAGFYVSFSAGDWQSPQEISPEDSTASFLVAALGLLAVGSQLPKLTS